MTGRSAAGLWVAAFVLGPAASGCELGRALIGDKPPPPRWSESFVGACSGPIACADAGPPAYDLDARLADAFELGECGGDADPPPVCARPEAVPPPADDDAGIDDDAGVETDRPGEPCRPLEDWQVLANARGELSCIDLAIDVDSAGTEVIELPEMFASLANLYFRAERPVTLRLIEPSMERTWIALDGPIRLELVRAVRLESVRVQGNNGGAGAPALHVVERVAEDMIVGSPEQPFEGLVDFQLVAVRGSQLVSEALTLESSTFYDGLLDAQQLDLVETELDHVELGLGDGQLAKCVLTSVEVTRCEELALFATNSTRSNFAACSVGPLRVYQSNITEGLVDGVVDADIADMCLVRLGRRGPTELRLWSGSFLGGNLCEQASAVVMGGRVARSGCEGELRAPGAVCKTFAERELDDNVCEQIRTAPVCENLPPHERPEQERDMGEDLLRNRD